MLLFFDCLYHKTLLFRIINAIKEFFLFVFVLFCCVLNVAVAKLFLIILKSKSTVNVFYPLNFFILSKRADWI